MIGANEIGDGIGGIEERYEPVELGIVYAAGIDPPGAGESPYDALGVGCLLVPEIDDIGDRAVLENAGVLFDVGADPDGEGFHRKASAEGECRADMPESTHPSVATAGDGTAASPVSKETTFEREVASWLMKSVPTVTEESR